MCVSSCVCFVCVCAFVWLMRFALVRFGLFGSPARFARVFVYCALCVRVRVPLFFVFV